MAPPLHLKATVFAATLCSASEAELHEMVDTLGRAVAAGGLSERLSRMAHAIARAALDEKRRALEAETQPPTLRVRRRDAVEGA